MTSVRKIGGFIAVACVTAVTGAVLSAPAADAAVITSTCNPFLVNAQGEKAGPLPGTMTQDITIGGFGNGVDIPAASSFALTNPSGPVVIPAIAEDTPLGDLPIVEVKNIIVDIKVTGAASIGDPTVSGGTVLGATIVKTAPDALRLTMPGSQTGSQTATVGSPFFPGGLEFQTPQVTTPLTVGAAGTTLSGSIVYLQIDSLIDADPNQAGLQALHARLECTPAANTLGTGNVVAPPAPGAPTASSDTATTTKDTAVVIDVVKNDTANPALAIDFASLKITAAPTNGTAVVADGKITYTPNTGFAGDDKLTYELCSVPSIDPLNPSGCDPADVTITIADAATAAATTTTTQPATATTAAAAALPRTGSSTAALTLLAAAFIGFGLALARPIGA